MNRYISLMGGTIIAVVSLLVFICLYFTEPLVRLTTSREYLDLFEQSGLFDSYILTTRILLLGPLAFTLQGILGVYLSIKKRFTVYSLAGAIYNVGMIVGILAVPQNGYLPAALGMTTSASIAAILLLVDGYQGGLRIDWGASIHQFTETITLFGSYIKQTWLLFLPRTLIINSSVAANQLIGVIGDGRAGQITAFDISLSIQSIFFVIISSTATVMFPDLAHVFNEDVTKNHQFWHKLRRYSIGVGGIGVIGAVITIIAVPLVMDIFQSIGTGQGNREYIILLTRISTLSLVFQAINEVIGKYFYIRKRMWQPVILSIITITSLVVTSLALINGFQDAGIAVSIGLGAAQMVFTIAALWYIRWDYKREKNLIAAT